MANVQVGELADLITQELENYSETVNEVMQSCIKKVAREALDDLKNNTIIPERTEGSDAYKKQFYLKKTSQGYILANKKYRLTHLLEHGHLTSAGTRTRAYPHWSRAQTIVETLPSRVERELAK